MHLMLVLVAFKYHKPRSKLIG